MIGLNKFNGKNRFAATAISSFTAQTLAVLCLLSILSSVCNGQDSVLLKQRQGRGSNVLGRITTISKNRIEVSSGNAKRRIDVNDLRRVSFGGEPGGLKSARQAVISGQYEQALEALQRIKADSRDSEMIVADIEFYKAYSTGQLAVRGAADARNAVRALLDFINTRPDSFHYYEAVELLGDLAVTLGKFDVAAKYYGDYAKAPFDDYKMRGGVLEANALRATEQYAAAEKRYEEVLSLPGAGPESAQQKTLAEIGRSACAAARGDHANAIAALEKVIANNDPSDAQVFAPAYNALGFAYQKAGKTMDAALAYLHVDVLFFSQRNEHAEALYHLSSIWNELNHPERAVRARKILAERYGGTVWAKRS